MRVWIDGIGSGYIEQTVTLAGAAFGSGLGIGILESSLSADPGTVHDIEVSAWWFSENSLAESWGMADDKEVEGISPQRSDNSNLRKETMNLATLFPAGSFSWTDVSALCLERGVHSVWGDRIRDMALHASSAGLSVAGCTRPTANFTRVRVTRKDWPSVGSITLDRADGSRWKLHMTPKTRKFKVTRMN